jgi:hypothetical protein
MLDLHGNRASPGMNGVHQRLQTGYQFVAMYA